MLRQHLSLCLSGISGSSSRTDHQICPSQAEDWPVPESTIGQSCFGSPPVTDNLNFVLSFRTNLKLARVQCNEKTDQHGDYKLELRLNFQL